LLSDGFAVERLGAFTTQIIKAFRSLVLLSAAPGMIF